MFAVHLKKDHYKCHVCDNNKHGNVYYAEYKNLQIHFEKSHFACTKQDCLEKSFVVFKTKDQLEDHLVSPIDQIKEHKENIQRRKVMLIQENFDEGRLFDHEGVDMTTQFLSLKKKKGQRKRDDYFDNTFDIREFYTKKKQALIYQKEKKRSSRLD